MNQEKEINLNSKVDTSQRANDFFDNNNKTQNNSLTFSSTANKLNNNTNLLNHETNSTSTPQSNPNSNSNSPPEHSSTHYNLSPILIAVIIIIPILAAILSVLYFRKSIFNRQNSLPNQFSQRSTNSNQSPTLLIIPPGGTGADRPLDQRRTDRFRRRIIGAIHRRTSRSDSIRTVPEYSADPQEAEISLALAQRSANESTLLPRFMTQSHLTQSSRVQPQHQSTSILLSTENHTLNPNHQNNDSHEPPPGYDLPNFNSRPNQNSSLQIESSSNSALPDPIQIVIPPSNQSSTHHQDHHQNLQIHRTLTSNSDTSSFNPQNQKPTSPIHQTVLDTTHLEFPGFSRGSSQSQLISPNPVTNTTSSTSSMVNLNNHLLETNDSSRSIQPMEADQPTYSVSPPSTNLQDYYRIPSGGPTPQQLSFLTRIGNLTRLGLPRPPQFVNHDSIDEPPPPFELDYSPDPSPSLTLPLTSPQSFPSTHSRS